MLRWCRVFPGISGGIYRREPASLVPHGRLPLRLIHSLWATAGDPHLVVVAVVAPVQRDVPGHHQPRHRRPAGRVAPVVFHQQVPADRLGPPLLYPVLLVARVLDHPARAGPDVPAGAERRPVALVPQERLQPARELQPAQHLPVLVDRPRTALLVGHVPQGGLVRRLHLKRQRGAHRRPRFERRTILGGRSRRSSSARNRSTADCGSVSSYTTPSGRVSARRRYPRSSRTRVCSWASRTVMPCAGANTGKSMTMAPSRPAFAIPGPSREDPDIPSCVTSQCPFPAFSRQLRMDAWAPVP